MEWNRPTNPMKKYCWKAIELKIWIYCSSGKKILLTQCNFEHEFQWVAIKAVTMKIEHIIGSKTSTLIVVKAIFCYCSICYFWNPYAKRLLWAAYGSKCSAFLISSSKHQIPEHGNAWWGRHLNIWINRLCITKRFIFSLR